jgi:glutaminyl-tRNA synthetase
LYDRLFNVEEPVTDDGVFLTQLNPHSLEVLPACQVEPSLASAAVGSRFQFERLGYFAVDPDSRPGHPVFNRTVGLKDTWAKIVGRENR